MTTKELESRIMKLYEEFIKTFSLDENTGLSEDSSFRFSGYPYVGSRYVESEKKILFIGLDTGVDERADENTYHDFSSRRKNVSITAQGKTYKELNGRPLNNHMAGTYLLTMYLLSEYHPEWDEAKIKLLKSSNSVNTTFLSLNKEIIPNDVLDYVAHVNIFKFVSKRRKRDERSGSKDRKWRNKRYEIDFLLREIDTFHPDILVFQGSHKRIPRGVMDDLKARYRVICGYHPSYWCHDANKVKYIQSLVD